MTALQFYFAAISLPVVILFVAKLIDSYFDKKGKKTRAMFVNGNRKI